MTQRLTRYATISIISIISLLPFATNGIAQEDVTKESLSSTLGDLKSLPPLPGNEVLLYQELNRVQADKARYRTLASSKNSSADEALRLVDQLRPQLQELFTRAASTNCTAPNTELLKAPAIKIGQLFSDLSFRYDIENESWDGFGISRQATPEQTCAALKAALTTEKQAALIADADKMRAEVLALQKDEQERSQIATEIVSRLEARETEILSKLKEVAGQQSVKEKLPIVIGLIGALSIGVLLVVRIFPSELQTEWINSGQVIQFVTVMVLLSVIMALGLAGIIQEETLGTLLGGIAGYVLSQGVGRAAAREVTRGVLAGQQDRGVQL